MKKLNVIPVFRLLVLSALAAVLASGCANIVKPGGGPRDEKPPELKATYPPSQTLNFDEKEVVFEFDEFIRPGNYAEDVFISPVMKKKPLVTVKGKKLVVRFQDELRKNTTYVISLGTGIKDFNESNKLKQPILYAFSTGDQLDSLSFGGVVQNPLTGKGEPEMTVLLYPANEIIGNDIEDLKPLYAIQTGPNGAFRFEYLRADSFKIYAVKDIDKTYTFNQPGEMLGLTEDPLIILSDTMQKSPDVELFAFIQDQEAPELKRAKWLNEKVVLAEFREPVLKRFLDDSLRIFLSDTLGADQQELYSFELFPSDKKFVYINMPVSRDGVYNLKFTGILDSLGFSSDTTVLLQSGTRDKTKEVTVLPPDIKLEAGFIRLFFTHELAAETPDSFFVLADTARNTTLKLKIEKQGFMMKVSPAETPEYNNPYSLFVKKGFSYKDGVEQDSLYEFEVIYPSPDNFGKFSGIIKPDSVGMNENWVMYFYKSGRKKQLARVTKNTRVFQYQYLEPGSYSISYLKDTDGNGVWTPGSLNPYRLPEEIIVDPRSIDIRAKWEIEEFEAKPIKVVLKNKGARVAAGDGDGEESDDGSGEKEKDEKPDKR